MATAPVDISDLVESQLAALHARQRLNEEFDAARLDGRSVAGVIADASIKADNVYQTLFTNYVRHQVHAVLKATIKSRKSES